MWPRVDEIYFASINLGRRWTSPWKLFNFTRFSNLFWALRDGELVILPTPRYHEIYWFYERKERTLWRCDVRWRDATRKKHVWIAKHSTSAIPGRKPEGKYLTGKMLSELQ